MCKSPYQPKHFVPLAGRLPQLLSNAALILVIRKRALAQRPGESSLGSMLHPVRTWLCHGWVDTRSRLGSKNSSRTTAVVSQQPLAGLTANLAESLCFTQHGFHPAPPMDLPVQRRSIERACPRVKGPSPPIGPHSRLLSRSRRCCQPPTERKRAVLPRMSDAPKE